jgi:hypothetical protein
VAGDHNSPRPKFMFDSAAIFLQTCLQIPNSWALNVPISMNLMCPPWYFEIHEQRAARRRQQQLGQAAKTSDAFSNGSSFQPTTLSPVPISSGIVIETGTPIAPPSGFEYGISGSEGFDHDEIGMTSERQRAIQASLFKMLGQADMPIDDDSNERRTDPCGRAKNGLQP